MLLMPNRTCLLIWSSCLPPYTWNLIGDLQHFTMSKRRHLIRYYYLFFYLSFLHYWIKKLYIFTAVACSRTGLACITLQYLPKILYYSTCLEREHDLPTFFRNNFALYIANNLARSWNYDCYVFAFFQTIMGNLYTIVGNV